MGGLRVGVVVQCGGVDVGNLLVKPAFAGANFANFIEQGIEICLAEDGAVFEAFLVEHIAADGEVAQNTGRPLAELGGALGIDPVADGDDGVEIVESGEVLLAVGGSIPEFPDNCRFAQLPAGKDVFEV